MNLQFNGRQLGKTTEQMRAAPENAIYVWCHECLRYPRALARLIQRTDLKIVGPSFFEVSWMGYDKPVVLDHAAPQMMNGHQYDGFCACRARLHVRGIHCD